MAAKVIAGIALAIALGIGIALVLRPSEAASPKDAQMLVRKDDGRILRITYEDYEKAQRELEEVKNRLREGDQLRRDSSKRIEFLEGELARLEKRLGVRERVSGQSGAGKPSQPGESPESHDRPDAEARAKAKKLLEGIDWDKSAAAILKWIVSQQEAAEKGKVARWDPETIAELSKLNIQMTEVAKLLDMDMNQVYGDELVLPHFMPAYMKAMGVELTAPQEESLFAYLRNEKQYSNREEQSLEELFTTGTLIRQAESELRFDEWMRDNLAPSQYQAYCATTGNDPFFGSQVPREPVKATSPAEAASAVGNFWMEAFEIPESNATQLGLISASYVDKYMAIRRKYEAYYGAELPRQASIEMHIELLELQQQAEKEIAETLQLTPDQAKKAAAGSMTVIQIEMGAGN